ncbi:MAG: DUF1592 domain-containing protein, partial [Pirellulaceae bacterium]|nr:DUF1592 domain-containing protein [Pirellulaceae bacterium]
LFALYQFRRQSGDAFHQAIQEPLAVILASPSFLYLSEPVGGQDKKRLTDLELAVRLSYFLWSGPPDEELYRVARQGRLSRSKVLRAQTDRMLGDPKAWEFVSGFTHQWLQMERLDFFQFNYRRYGEFDESVKAAARNEVYHTVATLIDDDLRIGKLLKSDFVVINDLLANYYGIDGVKGHHFRRVNLPSDSPRGGLLATAAVLAMGSDGERSSPVERGAWVMRKILHDPPPPAPANVPQLSRLADKMLPARKLQSAHMEEPQCAQCHRKIDPIGYGLENFDAAGRWRDQEMVAATQKKAGNKVVSFPIDASGKLPGGAMFANYFELRDQVAKVENAFSQGLTESLIAYGLGRPFAFSDAELAAKIAQSAADNDRRFRGFIHGLVQSDEFASKR